VILSDVTIAVEETWKGAAEKRENGENGEITIQLLGGRIGERWQYCADSPRYRAGEEVLVFARQWHERLWTTGWLQGKYRLARSAGGDCVIGKKKCPIDRTVSMEALRDRVRAIVRRAQAVRSSRASGEVRRGS
jgi:hypothetical protein